ncbi:MAG: hypothetical protein ACKV2Q_18130 [Planctomycetaceae bacterium]
MSPTKTTNRDPAEYLASVLPLNPIFQAEEILAARDRFLGRSTATAAASDRWQLQEQRAVLQARIDELRQQFWTAKPKELREALESLSVDQYPDLLLAVERLQAAFRVRADFPKLAQHAHCDEELFEQLKEIAVAAPREAGRSKHTFFLRTWSNLALHNRCRKMITMLRREFPDLYELEREWLQQFEKTKPIAGPTVSEKEADRRSKSDSGSGAGWLVAFVLLGGLGRACTSSSTQSTSTRPRFSPQKQQQDQETIRRWLEAQRMTSPNKTPGGSAPQASPPENEEARKRLEMLRQLTRERFDRQRNRVPDLSPPTPQPPPNFGPLQPRGP